MANYIDKDKLSIEIVTSKISGQLTQKAKDLLKTMVFQKQHRYQKNYNSQCILTYVLNNWYKIKDESKSYNYYSELIKRKYVSDSIRMSRRMQNINRIYETT